MGVWLCFGMLFVFLLLDVSAFPVRVVGDVVGSAVLAQVNGGRLLVVLSALHASCHFLGFGSCLEPFFARPGAVGGVVWHLYLK